MVTKFLTSSVNGVPYGLRRYIARVPGLAALQRAVVSRYLSGQPFIHTLNAGPAAGLRFEITLPLDKAVWAGTYEHDFAWALARSVRRGDVCYDVGGYRGYMTGIMALAGAAKVFVFEPLPANQNALRCLSALNPDFPIDIRPIAMGSVDGRCVLKVMPNTSMAKLNDSAFQPDARWVEELSVDVRRLDGLVAGGEIPAPNVVKIDVEGAEFQVLQGATRILSLYHPSIFLEAHSASLDRACTEQLKQLGYEVHHLESVLDKQSQTRHLIAVNSAVYRNNLGRE